MTNPRLIQLWTKVKLLWWVFKMGFQPIFWQQYHFIILLQYTCKESQYNGNTFFPPPHVKASGGSALLYNALLSLHDDFLSWMVFSRMTMSLFTRWFEKHDKEVTGSHQQAEIMPDELWAILKSALERWSATTIAFYSFVCCCYLWCCPWIT